MGLDEAGLSDHYVITPDGSRMSWSMPVDALDAYVEAVQNAAGEAGEELIVRLGIEADYYPETHDVLESVLASQPFDYVIGSVHRLDGFPIDDTAEPWERLTQPECDDIIRRYWIRLREMAESGLFDIAAHLDLTKKFGFRPSIDISSEMSAALNAIAASDMAVEINTAGWFVPALEVYPEESILRGCFDREIPVIITSDAHAPENLIRGFDRAVRYAWDMGYRSIASYSGRQRIMHELPMPE
jgi:histidinol-phosphatase (PHP family)